MMNVMCSYYKELVEAMKRVKETWETQYKDTILVKRQRGMRE